ncbi:MAG: alkaline phosphatase family protein, partial [Thermoanaerobaculia bacterium]|nr:alkaline phosphatase family protein [Thermoanaerobaculia bacterium]
TVEPDGGFYGAFRATPFSDAYLLRFAEELVRAEHLGQRDHLDYLAIGLSALDLVGHSFGPRSREVADVILRLDAELGTFLDELDATVGLDRVVIAVSSDHGVAPVPEISATLGLPGRRATNEDALCFQNAGVTVGGRFGLDDLVLRGLYLDRDAIEAAGLEPREVEAALARELEKCDIVARAWTRSELEATRSDEPERFRRLFRHSFDPERSADILLQLTEYSLPLTGAFTTHGSPYPYDTRVPLIFRLPGTDATRIDAAVRTVDTAPTLAALLGIPAPTGLDGVDLSTQLREHAAIPDLSAYSGAAP